MKFFFSVVKFSLVISLVLQGSLPVVSFAEVHVPVRIKDINQVTKKLWDRSESGIAYLNGFFYFERTDSSGDYGLWKSDGTPLGTSLVKNASVSGEEISMITRVGNRIFFTADDGVHGREVWSSDGTTEGTAMVADVCPGDCASNPQDFLVYGDVLIFNAYGGVGYDLYSSDGTTEGTFTLTGNINTGNGAYPVYMGVSSTDNQIYFGVGTGVYGLWKTDGITENGAELVQSSFIISGVMPDETGNIFFIRFNSGSYDLWQTDGSLDAGTLVKTGVGTNVNMIRDGIDLYGIANGGRIYFKATTALNGEEVWTSDGTALGTVLLKDINPGSNTSNPAYFAKLGGDVFFKASDGSGGYELWKTDGTEEGTVMLKDINPSGNGIGFPRFLTFGGILYFLADNGVNGQELWKTDGTEEGTVMVKDVGQYFGAGVNYIVTSDGSYLYFSADDGVHGYEFWKTDGTSVGTTMLGDAITNTEDAFSVLQIRATTDGLLFSANEGIHGYEIWKTDSTADGTVLVKDAAQGLGSNFSDEFGAFQVVLGDTLYFLNNDLVHGLELWKSDGTEGGTRIVKDIISGSEGSMNTDGAAPRVLGGVVYFAATNGPSGYELWKTDGTEEGTVMVKDVDPAGDAYIKLLDVLESHLYFLAYQEGETEYSLWKTDGTEIGTVKVKTFAGIPGEASDSLAIFGNELYFAHDDGVHGKELWKTNGTSEGTVLVKDIVPGSSSSFPQDTVEFDGRLYFVAYDELGDYSYLYQTDGTGAGTIIVPGLLRVSDYSLTVASSTMFAVVDNEDYTVQSLYKLSSGSSEFTLLKVIGVNGNLSSGFTAANGILYFAASDSEYGTELWKSDGTVSGTGRIADLYEGSLSSNPSGFHQVGNTLLFGAESASYGRELYRMEIPAPVVPVSSPEPTPTPPPSNGPIVVSSGGGGGGFAMPGTVKNYIVPNQPEVKQATTSTTTSVRNTAPITPLPTTYPRNLGIGSRGEDVRNLQKLLNSLGFIIASSGPGSPGNETTYYGTLTSNAVKRLQEANRERILSPFGLTSGTGYFGPATKKYLEGIRF